MAKQSKGKRKGQHASDKAQGLRYTAENRHSKNRMTRLLKHCSINENDKIAEKALNKCPVSGFPYRRQIPGILGNKTKQRKFKIITAGYGHIISRTSFKVKMVPIKIRLNN